MAIRLSFVLVLLILSHGLVLPAAGQAPAASASALTADAVDDPWLSEQGPVVAERVEVAREQVYAAWSESSKLAYARTAAARRVRLELGLGDLVAPAHVILGEMTDDDPEIYTAFALDLAPGVPLFQIAHVRALLATGDIGAAIGAMGDVIWAVTENLSARLWLIENFSFVLLIVVLAAPFGFILLAALEAFPHAAHDLGDLLAGPRMPGFARSAALAAFVLTPLVLGEGAIGLALSLFVLAFVYGKARQRSVLVMAAILLVIGLHPLAQFVSVVTTLVDRDPVARSVMAVISGLEANTDAERLEAVGNDDSATAHALAYRARRYGLEELSRSRLELLAEQDPSDGYVLAALGNIEMRRGNTGSAIGLYERASSEIDSETLYFDLSQAYARAFRMEESEASLSQAQRINSHTVAALSSLGDAALVADLPFPSGLLQDRFRRSAMRQEAPINLVETLAPGWLGFRWFVTAGAFGLAILFCLFYAGRFEHASRCARCGHRICTRCEETVWSEEICDDCHHLFQNPDATDPSLRMARLQALSKRRVRIDRIVLVGALLITGVAGLASRRPDFAMFGLLLFSWIAVWAVWPSGIFDDPLLMGHAAFLCFAIPGVLAGLSYAGIILASLVVRKNL